MAKVMRCSLPLPHELRQGRANQELLPRMRRIGEAGRGRRREFASLLGRRGGSNRKTGYRLGRFSTTFV